jgi:hypothetical protein
MTGPNSGGKVVFPSGMAGIQKKLAVNMSGSLTPGVMPTIMHNRQVSEWAPSAASVLNLYLIYTYTDASFHSLHVFTQQWSITSDYIKNWKDIPWYTSKKAGMAQDPAKFFERFFTQQQDWGLTMYEQVSAKSATGLALQQQ